MPKNRVILLAPVSKIFKGLNISINVVTENNVIKFHIEQRFTAI